MEGEKHPTNAELPTIVEVTRDPRYEVTWDPADFENPRTWSVWYRGFIVAAMSFSTTIV